MILDLLTYQRTGPRKDISIHIFNIPVVNYNINLANHLRRLNPNDFLYVESLDYSRRRHS